MQNSRNVLTPENLAMLQLIADTGSFAAAARELHLVPSALTYRVRQIEDALDVLLFDRSARQAHPTEAGAELLREGSRLLEDVDAIANHVRRVATGWEPQLTISVDQVMSTPTMLELAEAFFALKPMPPTRLKFTDGILGGTLECLTSGRADLAIGVAVDTPSIAGLQSADIGMLDFVFVVAPHHPLARLAEPLSDSELRQHRLIAVADSGNRSNVTIGILPGQDVMTVDSMSAKIQAQLRGIGAGFLPEPMVRSYLSAGLLVARAVERPPRTLRLSYVWGAGAQRSVGKALAWWLEQLKSKTTQKSLLENHHHF
ncbi:LysR family transcriptional regulator [Diaphorobacter aerolatus]|uniref:LysR family transcriptional regulator n=1 Tax=Diaphorobacter aerolatus TaxID=1288495 RepID=A0A7H0GL41_9BURK|nr:LysR family transcriptional regulator [Diaphorobacter aerolatus]QNP49007.1 LysR family transcriptional regulator [Diaphorobacter aerolatus]